MLTLFAMLNAAIVVGAALIYLASRGETAAIGSELDTLDAMVAEREEAMRALDAKIAALYAKRGIAR